MKWIKRFFIFILVLVLGGLAFLATSYWLSRRNPTWYKPLALNSREMEAAAHRAFNKVVAIHNMADYAAASDTSKKWREAHGVTTLPAPPPITISFTQDELTAFIAHWTKLNSDRVDRYLTGPQFVLEEGQIKFACRITKLDQIGVLRIEPTIDEKGMLHLEIVSVSAGSLPIPEAVVERRLDKAETELQKWIPDWQRTATIGLEGANTDAVKAAMSKLLLHTMHHQPSSPVLFMPIDSHKTVPMKLTKVMVGTGSITLTVEPLTEDDRKVALQSLREPIDVATVPNN